MVYFTSKGFFGQKLVLIGCGGQAPKDFVD
ncbi:MAG: hypothetical protein UV40_C0009G0014 [Parcubacteria group bacterium GW2011_GWA1_42_7]|nr:MAG: hypothetical protein UV34_C0026G0004 [Parcubacteria group bacterium GW2011_GWB1_42_6]KKS69968.1 MAG: hypothetical protein UV40_C0009G0014 [Parcubacteria group bacterium GW2011_GWA1_42_7]